MTKNLTLLVTHPRGGQIGIIIATPARQGLQFFGIIIAETIHRVWVNKTVRVFVISPDIHHLTQQGHFPIRDSANSTTHTALSYCKLRGGRINHLTPNETPRLPAFTEGFRITNVQFIL